MTDMELYRCVRCGNYWSSNAGPASNFEWVTRFCFNCVQIVSAAHLDLAGPPPPLPRQSKLIQGMYAVYELDGGFKIRCRGSKWWCYAPRYSGVGEHPTERQGWWYPVRGRTAAQQQIKAWMQEQHINAKPKAAT